MDVEQQNVNTIGPDEEDQKFGQWMLVTRKNRKPTQDSGPTNVNKGTTSNRFKALERDVGQNKKEAQGGEKANASRNNSKRPHDSTTNVIQVHLPKTQLANSSPMQIDQSSKGPGSNDPVTRSSATKSTKAQKNKSPVSIAITTSQIAPTTSQTKHPGRVAETYQPQKKDSNGSNLPPLEGSTSELHRQSRGINSSCGKGRLVNKENKHYDIPSKPDRSRSPVTRNFNGKPLRIAEGQIDSKEATRLG